MLSIGYYCEYDNFSILESLQKSSIMFLFIPIYCILISLFVFDGCEICSGKFSKEYALE